MSMHNYNYLLKDVGEGLRRNIGAALAASAFIFIAMTIIGMLLFVRFSVADVLGYLESQISIKVYVDPTIETEKVATILENNRFIDSVELETGQQMLDKLAFFFKGKEYLLESFQDSEIEDAIRLEVTDKTQTVQLATELARMEGISKVVYPQQFAATILNWSTKIHTYGFFFACFFFVMAFGMVYIAMNLALYQRQKEIRVKLLLGAKPSSVRQQFLFEGGLIGFIASIGSSLTMYSLCMVVLLPISEEFPFIFNNSTKTVYPIMSGIMLVGTCIGLSASYLSTRKLIKDV